MKYLIVFLINVVLINQNICQINSIQEFKEKLNFPQQDSSRSKIYSELSVLYIDNWYNSNFQKIENLDSALLYSIKSEELLLQNNNIPKSYKIWNKIGSIYMELYHHENEIEKRKKAINKALHIDSIVLYNAKFHNDSVYIKIALFNLSLKFAAISDVKNFFNNSLKMINLIKNKIEYDNVDSTLLLRVYNFYCYFLKYDKNPYYYNKFLSETEKFLPLQLSTKFLIFEKHSNNWKLDKEESLLQEYKTIREECQSIEYLITSDNILATYYINNNKFKKPIEIYKKNHYANFKKFNSSSLKNILGYKYLNLGKCAFKTNNPKKALNYLQKSLSYFNQSKDSIWSEKYLSLEIISNVYQELGDYKKAIYYNSASNQIQKQLLDIQILFSIAENEVVIEEIKRDKKIQTAHNQALLKEKEANIQKHQKFFFLLLSIAAILSTAWAIYNFIKMKSLSQHLLLKNDIISQQKEALRDSNILKDRLFALLSHDLRSSINGLIMSLNQNIDIQQVRLKSELKGIQDVLNNVLYWANMQLKNLNPILSDIPLKSTIESISNEYLHVLQDKNITFINSINRNFILRTDENYLKIILRNIISNAIKFTNSNGYIQIECKLDNNSVQIIIRDTGVGIPTDKMNTIFNLPSPTNGTKQEKGSGLGLSLSLDIAKKLNGNIKVISTENVGTQVIIYLHF